MNWTPVENYLLRPTHWAWTAFAFLCIAAVGVIDFLTGARISFSVFYLIPVAAAAWISGTTAAIVASALAASLWLSAEMATSRLDSSMFVYAWNFCARLLFLLLVAVLLARLRKMLLSERQLSRTDALTGALNLRAMRETIDAEIDRGRRYPQSFSLAFIDIDDFKHVNDSQGHRAGDRLLEQFAEVIRGNLRASDAIARLGGDEFVMLLPMTDGDSARATVEKIRARLGEIESTGRDPVTVSIGVVSYAPGEQLSVDAMLEHADRLMYEAKSAGKNCVVYGSGIS